MLKMFFPFIQWVNDYSPARLRADAVSGLTVALILVPQAMAYAQLAGLPIYYGLYASFLPPMVAALFGSSRQLATGPVAVVSLMTSVALGRLAVTGSEGYFTYAVCLAFLVGAFQFALGALRLGLVVNFISHPVINGFSNAAALIIATSQLSKIFGVSVDSGEYHYETVYRVCRTALTHIHWPTFLLGAFAFAVMYGVKRHWPRAPYVLIAVVATTLISWGIHFDRRTHVPLSAIAPPPVRQDIRTYNATIAGIEGLAQTANALRLRIMEVEGGSGGRSVERIELKGKLAVTVLKQEELRERAAAEKQKIRALAFLEIRGQEGPRFYEKDALPRGLHSDGRTWRLKVGQGALDDSAIEMTGGGEVIGVIPRGLPSFSLPPLNPMDLLRLLPYAVIISLLGFMEAISIAKAMAARTGQRLDPNQELIGQGLGNMVGSMNGGYPVSGSFSRTAVNFQSGAVTGFSSVFTGLAVALTLLFFTPLLYHTPQSVLAAIIMMAVMGLVNVSGFLHAWRARRSDGVISLITFLLTLGFAPHLDTGILIGIGLSLLVFLYRSMRPRVVLLSRLSDGSYHDAGAFGMKMCEHVAMVRFDGPLFFANASYLEDQIARLRRNMPLLSHIHIESGGIDDMDATGEEVLSLIVDRLRSAGVGISFSGLKKNVLDVMKRTRLYEKIGRENIYPSQDAAARSIYESAHRHSEEGACPLTAYCPVTAPEDRDEGSTSAPSFLKG